MNFFAALVGMPSPSEIIHYINFFYLQEYMTSYYLTLIERN